MSLWGDAADAARSYCDGCDELHLLNADDLCRVCAELDRDGLLWL